MSGNNVSRRAPVLTMATRPGEFVFPWQNSKNWPTRLSVFDSTNMRNEDEEDEKDDPLAQMVAALDSYDDFSPFRALPTDVGLDDYDQWKLREHYDSPPRVALTPMRWLARKEAPKDESSD